MITLLDQDFSALNHYIKNTHPSRLFFVTDENTHENCLPITLANLDTGIPYEILEIEAGEEMKNIETATQIWEILAGYEADRKALIINLGGGVITDMGGFVASTYKRGIAFVNLPTSLLGMCDASIGGKTGIDLRFLKNIVGTFALPEHIFVFPGFLKTLPFKELRSGFAEMLKHGLIADAQHWKNLTAIETLTAENITPHIETSMNIKQKVVDADFREKNIRKILNFGHTVGHAIESLCLQAGNLIPHGEAVAAGMICETYLAFLEGLITEKLAQNLVAAIRRYYPDLDLLSFQNEDILKLMFNDKKNEDGKINFSLIDGVGSCRYDYRCSRKNILQSILFYKSLAE